MEWLIGLATLVGMGAVIYGGIWLMDNFAHCDECGARMRDGECQSCLERFHFDDLYGKAPDSRHVPYHCTCKDQDHV